MTPTNPENDDIEVQEDEEVIHSIQISDANGGYKFGFSVTNGHLAIYREDEPGGNPLIFNELLFVKKICEREGWDFPVELDY